MLSEFFRFSPSPLPPLKIGVLLDGTALSRSAVAILEDIRRSNFANINCLVVRSGSVALQVARPARWRRIRRRLSTPALRRRILYDLYERWDRRHIHSDDPLTEIDAVELLKDIPRIDVEPITKGFVDIIPETAVSHIREYRLDVLIRFGFNILRGSILHAAKYGVWSFHHGDNDSYRGGPALFWELWEDNPISGVILQVLTTDLDAGHVLCKSLFATQHTFSLAENRHGPFLATTHMVIRKLNEVHQRGWSAIEAGISPNAPYRGKRRLYRTPTNADMLQWIARRAVRRLRRSLGPAMIKHWSVGVRHGGPFLDEAAERGTPFDPAGFRWLPAPKGRFWADPFLMEHDGQTWLFVEEFDYARNKGWISAGVLDGNRASVSFRSCLEEPHHLSFPFVFRHDGEMFLVPESAAAGKVVLYRARNFPFEWVEERVLLVGNFVDSVLWHDRSWWLLTTVREPAECAVHSMLFSADTLHGDWALHPASPLFNDVRNARNAGPVFQRADKWYRVSQDCSVEYGHSFRINEITELNASSYRERERGRLEPTFLPKMVGTHTYGRAGEWEVIDGYFRVPRRHVV